MMNIVCTHLSFTLQSPLYKTTSTILKAKQHIITNHPQFLTMDYNPSQPGGVVTATSSTQQHLTHKTLAAMGNLANLLPRGAVLIFQTLIPSFSNKGICQTSNRWLILTLVAFCTITCFLSTFTDSFTNHDGRLFYGFATYKGLHVFGGDQKRGDPTVGGRGVGIGSWDLGEMKVSLKDFVHAFVSMFVFWAYALSNNDVQKCLFQGGGENWDVLMVNLPIAAGVFASFLFVIFPTTRRGIGHPDVPNMLK